MRATAGSQSRPIRRQPPVTVLPGRKARGAFSAMAWAQSRGGLRDKAQRVGDNLRKAAESGRHRTARRSGRNDSAVEAEERRPLMTRTGVDPVWWSPSGFQRRLQRCREPARLIRLSSAARWLNWSAPVVTRRSSLGSLSRRRNRSAIGLRKPTGKRAAGGEGCWTDGGRARRTGPSAA
jgi:hypothetical protein